jgi:hypothetical protein
MQRLTRISVTGALLAGGLLLGVGSLRAQEAPEPPEAQPTLGLCGALGNALVEDFESGSSGFYVFNDGTGQQTSADGLGLVVRGGPKKSRYALQTAGDDFVDWGAGLGVGLGCGYDVRAYNGVRFAAKADGAGTFNVQVVTLESMPVEFGGQCEEGCNDYYMLDIALPDDRWYECGFGTPVPLDLTAVSGLQYGFQLDDMPFDLSLDNITFARGIRRTSCVPLEPARPACPPGKSNPPRGR